MANNNSNLGMVFISGIALGYVISLLLPKDLQDENRQRLRNLKEVLTDPDERERIKEIFKDRTTDAIAAYHMSKDRLARNLSEAQEQIGTISRDKYIHAVQDAIDFVADYQELPKPQLNALKKYLESDFQRVKSALQSP